MAQFGRPNADTYIGNWEDEGQGTSNIYQSIDETVESDADYVASESAPSSSPYVCALSTLEDPVSSSNHTMRYAYQKSASGGAQIDLTVELREGYVNEGSPGTLIKQIQHSDISNGWTANPYTLSGGEADTITDYTDLFFRFVADQP